jgi:hypothetical protein
LQVLESQNFVALLTSIPIFDRVEFPRLAWSGVPIFDVFNAFVNLMLNGGFRVEVQFLRNTSSVQRYSFAVAHLVNRSLVERVRTPIAFGSP